MRKRFNYILVLLFSLIVLFGCSKKDEYQNDGIEPEDTFFYDKLKENNAGEEIESSKIDVLPEEGQEKKYKVNNDGTYTQVPESYDGGEETFVTITVTPGGNYVITNKYSPSNDNETKPTEESKPTTEKENSGCSNNSQNSNTGSSGNSNSNGNNAFTQNKNNYVSYNGWLKVSGTTLVNSKGERIQLRGMSSHGLQWYGNLVTEQNIQILKNQWGSNVFRLAMYTAEGGYLSNSSIKSVVETNVDMLVRNDMYVIIDWHILSDNSPSSHTKEAVEFFDYMSKKYANTPNVIYEICNEPNNSNWNNDIKPYADSVVAAIRKNSKNSIIIVGTNTWSQDVLDPINNRVNDSNVMYSLHFYSGTHTSWLRDRAQQALNSGIPLFVSEWGTSSADGNGGVFIEESQKWVDFMKTNNISWTSWSLCDKNESSALLKPGSTVINDANLSTSGQFVKKAIIG